ncbi:MAG: PorT family protein [candidate division Zixibacteria bacterium]|nr:PorT family protein [candidate division Zixibacteria bacterium]
MKKLLLVLAVVLLFAISGFAQTEGTGLTAKGIKLGVNLSKATGGDVDESDMKLGFGGGAFVEYSFNPQFAVQPELLFMMKGDKVTVGDKDYKNKLTYIEVPVLLKFKPTMEGNFKPVIFAGPAIGLLMSAKSWDIDTTQTPPVIEDDVDVKDNMKSIDFGIAFGAGFMYMMQNGGGITFDVRYTMGLAKVPDPEEGDAPDMKNTNISFMVGYSF